MHTVIFIIINDFKFQFGHTESTPATEQRSVILAYKDDINQGGMDGREWCWQVEINHIT